MLIVVCVISPRVPRLSLQSSLKPWHSSSLPGWNITPAVFVSFPSYFSLQLRLEPLPLTSLEDTVPAPSSVSPRQLGDWTAVSSTLSYSILFAKEILASGLWLFVLKEALHSWEENSSDSGENNAVVKLSWGRNTNWIFLTLTLGPGPPCLLSSCVAGDAEALPAWGGQYVQAAGEAWLATFCSNWRVLAQFQL